MTSSPSRSTSDQELMGCCLPEKERKKKERKKDKRKKEKIKKERKKSIKCLQKDKGYDRANSCNGTMQHLTRSMIDASIDEVTDISKEKRPRFDD